MTIPTSVAILFILSLAILFVQYAGIIAYDLFIRDTDLAPAYAPHVTGTKPASPAAPSSETVTWQTYHNEKYEFEFQYPPDWSADILTHDEFGRLLLSISLEPTNIANTRIGGSDLPPYMDISLFATVQKLDSTIGGLGVQNLQDLRLKYTEGQDPIFQYARPKIIAGTDGFEAKAGPTQFAGGIYYIFQRDNVTYEIWQWTEEPKQDGYAISQKILSTFRFLD